MKRRRSMFVKVLEILPRAKLEEFARDYAEVVEPSRCDVTHLTMRLRAADSPELRDALSRYLDTVLMRCL